MAGKREPGKRAMAGQANRFSLATVHSRLPADSLSVDNLYRPAQAGCQIHARRGVVMGRAFGSPADATCCTQ